MVASRFLGEIQDPSSHQASGKPSLVGSQVGYQVFLRGHWCVKTEIATVQSLFRGEGCLGQLIYIVLIR